MEETNKIPESYYMQVVEGLQMYYQWYVDELKQQLQSYKDKEDKLREFLENEPNDLYSTTPTKKYWVIDILQILNEGGKNDR